MTFCVAYFGLRTGLPPNAVGGTVGSWGFLFLPVEPPSAFAGSVGIFGLEESLGICRLHPPSLDLLKKDCLA